MAEQSPDPRPATMLSGDGEWWWDGSRWLAALTPDGLWRWDGAAWQPTFELRATGAAELASTISLLAEDRFAQAGAILAAREREWRGGEHVHQLVGQSFRLHERLRSLESQRTTGGHGQGLGAVLGRIATGVDERGRLEEEHDRVAGELRAAMVHIGRSAPQPSVKEADELLATARVLDERVAFLTSAAAVLDDAEREHAELVAAAHAEVIAAERDRLTAIAGAEQALEEARGARARAAQETRERLEALRSRSSLEVVASFGALTLSPDALRGPGLALGAARASVRVDGAEPIWKASSDLVRELLLLGDPGAAQLHRCRLQAEDGLFMLVAGATGATVTACSPGEEEAARQFADAVEGNRADAQRLEAEREAEALQLERELRRLGSPDPKAAAAQRRLAELESDLTLTGPIEEAQRRLAEAQGNTASVDRAREHLEALMAELTSPPRPLSEAPSGH